MGLKRRLYYAVNSDLRYIIRKYYYLPIDIFEKITRKRHPLVPPKGLIFTGRGNYIVQGEQFLEYFKKYCGLQPNHKVLDVGCGVGRMAIPLVSYLNTEGTYDGFDIVKKGIRWCNTHFRKQHPNFRFHYVDIYNKLYNAKGETQAEDFKFPFNDESFDFVFLVSVFTHMLKLEVENYTSEIARVLKKGGKCCVTFFLMNQEAKTYSLKAPAFIFKHEKEDFYLMDTITDTANVAYEESYINILFPKNNLKIVQTLYGFWSGRPKEISLNFQDVIVAEK